MKYSLSLESETIWVSWTQGLLFFKSSFPLKSKPVCSYLYPIVTLSLTDGSFQTRWELAMCHTSGQSTLVEHLFRKSVLILHKWSLRSPSLWGLSLVKSEQPVTRYSSSSPFRFSAASLSSHDWRPLWLKPDVVKTLHYRKPITASLV